MIITRQRDNVRLLAFRKSAHTSLINTFCTEDGSDVVRGTMGEYKDSSSASVTIAFFRNPLARLVSAYNHLVAGDELHGGLAMWGYEHEMDFEDFIRLTIQLPDKEIDLHFASQSYQTCLALEEHFTEVIWLGQVEQLPMHWLEMQNFTGLWNTPNFLPNFNERPHKPWPLYYTQELVHEALSGRYMDDYRRWASREWR